MEQSDNNNALDEHFDYTRAERSLEEIRKLQEQKDQIVEHAKSEIERINQWMERETKKRNKTQQYHKQNLTAFLDRKDRKTIKLINGVIKSTKGRQKIEIIDEEIIDNKFMTETISRTPNKKLILQHIQECGEIPDGTDIIEGEKTYTIRAYTKKSEPEFFADTDADEEFQIPSDEELAPKIT